MADIELKSDEEKAEELKQWWKENGLSVAAGIALAIGGMFGWQQWKVYTKNQAEGGSRLYAQLSDPDRNSSEIAEQLNSDFNGTPYSALASLKMAKSSCENGEVARCIEHLRQASKSSQEDIAIIAELRLARALVSAGQLNEAEKLLTNKRPAAYDSLQDEILGDIHFARKQYDKAREAYDRAILSSGGQDVDYLQMKKNDLGNI